MNQAYGVAMRNTVIFFITLFLSWSGNGQKPVAPKDIASRIGTYKKDERGVYASIRWFCKDGSIRMPRDPCPEDIGGIQHATYKDEVIALGRSNHIFLGQILAYTENEAFWDAENQYSRLKQYQLGRYLAAVDDGWVNRKGQYYRGAVQIEDEEQWGLDFFRWLLAKDDVLRNNYFLVFQALRDIPHQGDTDIGQLMRTQSKVLSDKYPKFMPLRIKIHGNPEHIDIQKTQEFIAQNTSSLTPELRRGFDVLVQTLSAFHQPINTSGLKDAVNRLTSTGPLTATLKAFAERFGQDHDPVEFTQRASEVLLEIRQKIIQEPRPSQRLILMDLALNIERILFREAALWEPVAIGDLLKKIHALSMAATGTGGLELWEWDEISSRLMINVGDAFTLGKLIESMETARGAVEWTSAMVKAHYQEIINTYQEFEPLAIGFIDDRIRSSLALQLGKSVAALGDFIARESSVTNAVLSLPNQNAVRGLNPGYAKGELVVVQGNAEVLEVSSEKIYLFERAPSDLKPVAGILTVSEGNLVSHVQLLARNLGIPNAAVPDDVFQSLLPYHGQQVFYAVSHKGNVILKMTDEMDGTEKALFEKTERLDTRINVPTDRLNLDLNYVLNLRDVDARASGISCGPKAANLGQLKKDFPEQVVEGFVIPFGIFKDHMDQAIPGKNQSYWEMLQQIFEQAEEKRKQGEEQQSIEEFQIKAMEALREEIKKMTLKNEFINDLQTCFSEILQKQMGTVGVFLRSDTNMEDLKDFTGAGLNLTLFNVRDPSRILQGIKDVWASPYTERSFKWRQRFLLNPENVFPSILIIPSVNVDYSGVLITKGLRSGELDETTVAFSRGVGGAVEGQAAETRVIRADGSNELLSPAREIKYTVLPASGGVEKSVANFSSPILTQSDLRQLNALAKNLNQKHKDDPERFPDIADVELGFLKGKIWLFQIRPFVENKRAVSSAYLESITPKIDTKKKIARTQTLSGS